MKKGNKVLMGAMAGLLAANMSATDTLADQHATAEKEAKKPGFFQRMFDWGGDKDASAEKDPCGGKDGCASKDGHEAKSKDACGGKDG